MYSLVNNQLTFKRGFKPSEIKDAQRDVREAYNLLCKENAPRSAGMAKAILMTAFGGNMEKLSQVSPLFSYSLASASRAYAAIGPKLARTNMYHMNIYVPVKVLAELDTVSMELVQELEVSGLTEVVILAKES